MSALSSKDASQLPDGRNRSYHWRIDPDAFRLLNRVGAGERDGAAAFRGIIGTDDGRSGEKLCGKGLLGGEKGKQRLTPGGKGCEGQGNRQVKHQVRSRSC